MNKRVILTGATGLIGRQTIGPLQDAGFDVIALGRTQPNQDGVEFVSVDLLDQGQVNSVVREISASHLVHLAWHSGGSDRWHSAKNIDWAAATLGLFRTFADSGGCSVVAAGSCAEYDWSEQGPFSEDDRLVPVTLYGKAKAATGQLLLSAAADLGVTVAWARIFFCYGPGEQRGRLVGDLVAGLREGREVACTDGLQERDFLHTHDIGRVLAMLANENAHGAVNVASGVPVAIRDLALAVEKLMNCNGLVRLGAIDRPNSDPPLILADTSKLMEEFGFQPIFDIESGLADVIRHAANI